MATAEAFCVVPCDAFHTTHVRKHESEFIWRQIEVIYFVLSKHLKLIIHVLLTIQIFRYCRTIYKTFCLYKHRKQNRN